MLWKNWLINRLGSLVIVAGPRQARFFHGPSMPTDNNELICRHAATNNGINNDSMIVITHKIIKICSKKLKPGKDDGDMSFKLDHLIHGDHQMHVVLSMLFNTMLVHGYTPSVLLKSTILSIPKDDKTLLSSSDNYRGISLFNCICKLYDQVI